MAQSNLFPVSNDSGKHLILNPPTNPPSNWAAGLLYPASIDGAERGLMIRFGSANFNGNDSTDLQTGVAHGLGRPPAWVDVFPALQSFGGPWGGLAFQYAAADSNAFYVQFEGAAVPGSNPTQLYTFGGGVTYYFNWIACAFVT